MESGTPTLLVFTLGAAAESARRGLLPEALRGVEIGFRQGCLDAALGAGRACGCRLEVCSPSPLALPEGVSHVPQPGTGFGGRLEQAVSAAFERGAGPLVVVGSDVPGLATRHVSRALDLLTDDPDRVVLGPSPDGGFYLLAFRRPIPGLRTATRWCRRDTLRGMVRSLRAAGRPVVLLEPLTDLDGRADLESWLARPAWDDRWYRLRGTLRRLLAEASCPLLPLAARLLPAFAAPLAGRSPPALLSAR
jgi:hypothetical protein